MKILRSTTILIILILYQSFIQSLTQALSKEDLILRLSSLSIGNSKLSKELYPYEDMESIMKVNKSKYYIHTQYQYILYTL